MGDLANTILSAVDSALSLVGSTRQVKIITEGALNMSNPGAGKAITTETVNVPAVLYDYKDTQIDGTTILTGDRQAIISILNLTADQKAGILAGNYLIDNSVSYTIIKTTKYEIEGVVVTYVLQIRLV